MTEIIFAILNIVFILYHAWYVYEHDKQTKMLTRALLSKDINDFIASDTVDKKQITKKADDDLISLDSLTDRQFNKIVKQSSK
jgi:predicted DNA binding protein